MSFESPSPLSLLPSILFVTAFKDIRRADWPHYNLSNGRYFDYFCDLAANIEYPLVVYLEEETKRELFETRAYRVPAFRPNVEFRDLAEVPDTFFDVFLERDREIIDSAEYKATVPDCRRDMPEHNYSEYNLINHSKINFVRDAKALHEGKNQRYDFYAWIDFGRMNERIENIPSGLDLSTLPLDAITYHCVNDPPPEHVGEAEMLGRHGVYFLGSSFIAPAGLVEPFEKLWRDKLVQWQAKNTTDDDQNLVLQLYFDNRALIHGIRFPDWYGMYRALKRANHTHE
jgi:hypothetical protein